MNNRATLAISREALRLTLSELHKAAVCAYHRGAITGVAHISTAVANIIGGSGGYGSTEQKAAMDMANEAGFRPEYYVDSIRVHFVPPTQEAAPDRVKECIDRAIAARPAKPRGELPANTGKPWTAEHDATVQAEFNKGTPTKEIAAMVGRTRWAVESRLMVLGKTDATT